MKKTVIILLIFSWLFSAISFVEANETSNIMNKAKSIELKNAPTKEALLEETLYSRYYTYLDKKYSDFILCPRIDKIERIEGDIRRHIVYASALNYDGHHNGVYDRIDIILTDTPDYGAKFNEIKIQKNIPEKESIKQCK